MLTEEMNKKTTESSDESLCAKVQYKRSWRRLLTQKEREFLYNRGTGRTFAELGDYTE